MSCDEFNSNLVVVSMSSIPGERLTSDLCLIVCAFLEEMWVVNGLRPQDFRHSEFSFSESSAAESSIPKNLQQQFSFIGDNAVIAHLAEQLGHGCLGSDHFTLSHFSCKDQCGFSGFTCFSKVWLEHAPGAVRPTVKCRHP